MVLFIILGHDFCNKLLAGNNDNAARHISITAAKNKPSLNVKLVAVHRVVDMLMLMMDSMMMAMMRMMMMMVMMLIIMMTILLVMVLLLTMMMMMMTMVMMMTMMMSRGPVQRDQQSQGR